jgi:hypothetical protein
MTETFNATDAKDTYLYESAPTTNYGSGIGLAIFDKINTTIRSILEFDISGLPVGATLITATLGVYYTGDTGWTSPTGVTVWAYKLSRTNWIEAEATWNIYKTGSDWTTPGSDYVTSSPVGGSTTVPASPGWMSWNVLSIVQDAYTLGNAAEFLLKFPTEQVPSDYHGIYLYAKEQGTPYIPTLVVTYTTVWTHVAKVNGVASSAISKINGVAVTSIAKINGVV